MKSVILVMLAAVFLSGCFSSGPSASDIKAAYAVVHMNGLQAIGVDGPKISAITWHQCKELTSELAWVCSFKATVDSGERFERNNVKFTKSDKTYIAQHDGFRYVFSQNELRNMTYSQVAMVACNAVKNASFEQLAQFMDQSEIAEARDFLESDEGAFITRRITCDIVATQPRQGSTDGAVTFAYWMKGPESSMWLSKKENGQWEFGNK